MSRISGRFDETTNMLLGTLTDCNPIVVGYDRPVAHNGGDVTVLIDDTCLQSGTLFQG